jgi:uncharacterized protein YoxC
MLFLEILVAVSAISFVLFIIGRYIYKRKKGTYMGECENCSKNISKGLKKIRKELDEEHNCCCNK